MQTALAPIRDIANPDVTTAGGGNANTGRAAMAADQQLQIEAIAPVINQQVSRLNHKEQ